MIEVNWNPTTRQLRQFGAVWLAMALVLIGGLVYYHTGSLAAALWLWLPAGAVSVAGLLRPQWMRPLYVGWICAAYPIGWTVSHLVMVVVYFAVVTPIGVIMRLLGRDPLQRRFDSTSSSYWVPRQRPAHGSRYFRQF